MRIVPVEEITVRTLLAEPELRALRLLAGSTGIDRPIRAATIMDTPYIGNWLRGGELVLGSGFFLVQPMRDVDLIRTLAEAGAVGLGMKLRHFGGRLSPEAVEAAEAERLAVLEVPDDWGWTGIIDCVHRAIGRREAAVLDLARRCQEHFLAPLLDGASPDELLADLASVLHRPVALVDAALERVMAEAYPPDWSSSSAALSAAASAGAVDERVVAELRAGMSAGNGQRLTVHAETTGRTWSGFRQSCSSGSALLVPVRDHDRTSSFLVVLEGDVPLIRECVVLVGEASSVVALRMEAWSGLSRREDRDEFLFSVLSGKRPWTPETAVAGRYHGWDLGCAHTAFVCGIDEGADAEDRLGIARELERHILATVPGAVVGRRRDLVFGLLPAPDIRSRKSGAVERLRRAWASMDAGARGAVTIGVGRMSLGPEEFAYSFSLAEQALHLAKVFFGPGGAVSIDDLAPYRLLWDLREQPDSREAVERVLGPLLDSPDDLLGTLKTYLESGAKIKEAAARLYVHRNTLRARLAKIHRLTGLDPHRPRERFLLELLVLLQGLIGSRGAGGEQPHESRGSVTS